MWIIRTLLILLAFSAYTYAFYIKTDNIELQQESSDINSENQEEYKNYLPEPRSLRIQDAYEKIRNFLTIPWHKSNLTDLTPENMQNGSHYENMQQNELSFDPYHLTRNISRSDPVDFHASEILPVLSEKYLKINLTAGQKFKERDNFLDDSKYQFKNAAINDLFSDVSESDKEIDTKQGDEDEPVDLLRSLIPLDNAENGVEAQDNKTLESNDENIMDASIDKENVVNITAEQPNNDIAGDINHISEDVEYMIEDSEEQFSTTRAQFIGTTMIPSDGTTYNTQENLDFIQSNTETEENFVNGDEIENFNGETTRNPEISTILSGGDDDLIVIAGTIGDIRTYEKKFTETPISFDKNDDSLIIQGHNQNSNGLTTQFPTEETTLDAIPEMKTEVNFLNNPSSDISITIPTNDANLALEEHTNTDLDKNIFMSTTSTFEENGDQIPETTTEFEQIENINENAHKVAEMVSNHTDDLIVLATDLSNIQKHEITNEENENDRSLIMQGRGLNNDELMTQFPEGESTSTQINEADADTTNKVEINILNKIKPSSDIFSMTSDHLAIFSTTILPITTNYVLKEQGSNLDENISTFTTLPHEESSLKIVNNEEVFHDQILENIIEVDRIAETTTLIDQSENIKSNENDDLNMIVDEPKNLKTEANDSPNTETTTTSQSEFTTIKVENGTKDSSYDFTTEDITLKTFTDVDTTNDVNTENNAQKGQLNEVSTITAPVYIDEDLTLPILTDAFNVLEISEELVKPRSTLNKPVDTLEILGIDEQDVFTHKIIEITTLKPVETKNPTDVSNQYINHHHQNEELPTEFVTDDQTIQQKLLQITPSTEFNKDIDFTTAKFFELFEKNEDVSDHDRVIYTTTLSDSTSVDNDPHNNYDLTTLSSEEDQTKMIPIEGNARSFDFSMNLDTIPKDVPISISTTQNKEDHRLDLTTEEIVDLNQFPQSIITSPPFNHIGSDEPSKIVSDLVSEDKTYLTATEGSFGSHKEDSLSMKINDQFSDILSTSEYIFTTELPKIEIFDKKYQNNEFSTVSNELEHHEDILRTTKNSVFEDSVTDGKIDPENGMTTVNQLYSITNILFDNTKIPQQLELSTEDSKLLEIASKNSFEPVTPIFIENEPFNSLSESIINESNETNRIGENSSELESVHSKPIDKDSAPEKYNDLLVDLTTKFDIMEKDDSDENNQHQENFNDDETQQTDSGSNGDSSNDTRTQIRALDSKSTNKENDSETSDSNESNETEKKPTKVQSTQSESSEENSSSIEISDETIDNKSDVSTSESKQSEETPSDEESALYDSIEEDSHSEKESALYDSIEEYSLSTELSEQTANNKSHNENSESNDSNISDEKSAESKTFNGEKKTHSESDEEDSSSVEINDNGIASKAKVKKNKFDNEDSESNDSNHSGERSSSEELDKNIQSTSTKEDISSLESSDQSDDHDYNIKFKKTDESEGDSSNESVEEIIPYPIQKVPQGRSFSFDNENNNGQQITSDEKSPPFTKVVLSDPDPVENVDQSIVVNKVDNSDTNNNRGMDGDSLDSDDVSTAVVETLIEAAELTTEFTRHISSFRTPSEASNTISDTTYETPTTSLPPDMDESDREKLHSLAHSVTTSAGTSRLTVLSFCLIGVAIFAIVATISAALIFKFHKRRETFDIQLEERHEKKDSNTTQSTTNGVE